MFALSFERSGAARSLFVLLLALFIVCAPLGVEADQRGDSAGTASRSSPARGDNAARGQRNAAPRNVEASQRARLVLVIVIDQFRYEYLERFGDLFAQRGFRRLQRDGASWANAHYDHIPTETAPGHATILTGAWPSETGIIGNFWYDRARARRVSNVEDETARLIGGGEKEEGAGPRALLASSLGDELKLATGGRAKVYGISIKDRGAILPAGRMGDGAFWFSEQTGQFVSSTYYFNQLPAWVARYNESRPADKYFGAKWERLLPAAEYERRTGGPDDAEWEKGDGSTPFIFPYTITGGGTGPGPNFYNALTFSPYTNDMLVQLAEHAVVAERLGSDADTDILSISFSANDLVGHRYGPYSHEVMDMTLRTDRQIEQLLNMIEARVGLRHTLVVLTADHGVAPIPDHAARMQLPGGRVQTQEMMNAIRARLRVRFGKSGGTDNTADYVQTFSNGQVYFNRAALERDGVRSEDAERVAGEAALTIPGIMRYFTRTQLLNGAVSPADPVARRALHGYNPARSGDVVIVQEPFKYMTQYAGATHGAPYSYDTHVPLIIMGSGLRAGLYTDEATPADIAPTLSQLLRVQPPSSATGRVLKEALMMK